MRNIEKRGTTPNLSIYKFAPCSHECPTCSRVELLLEGTTKVPKYCSKGRPYVKTDIWDKAKSNKLLGETVEIDTSLLTKANLEQLPKGMLDCQGCSKLIQRPVTVSPCDHSFCVHCILREIEGKASDELQCPKCLCMIGTIFASKKLVDIINKLILKCEHCLEEIEFKEYEQHVCTPQSQGSSSSSSRSSQITVSDIMDIENESDISPEVNDAVLHVLRKKLSESSLPNRGIVFNAGGRVSTYLPFFFKSKGICRGGYLRIEEGIISTW